MFDAIKRVFSKKEDLISGPANPKPVQAKHIEETKKKVEKIISESFDPKLQKKIYKEEMKIARRIAIEFNKRHKKYSKIKDFENCCKHGTYKTGIKGFDALLKKGGIPLYSSTLIEGGPGSGKTIFCLQVAMNFCRQGKKVLYMSFEEPEERLLEHVKSLGCNVNKCIKKSNLMIKRFNALDIARSVEALLSEAKKELLIDVQPILIPSGFEPDLVVIDSLTSISSAFSGEDNRFRIYMEQLFRYLEKHKITALLIREVPNPTHVGANIDLTTEGVTSFLSDGIIVFYNVIFNNGKRTRAIEILKLRGQDFERKIVQAEIKDKKGFIVYPNRTLKGNYRLT